jgi:hypothetical protein
MILVLDGNQRESLYNLVLTDLSGIGDVTLCLDAGRINEGRTLGRQFAQDVALLEQISWELDPELESYEVNLPDAEALAICRRFCQVATGVISDGMAQRADRALDDAFRVAAFCNSVIKGQAVA